MKQYRVWVRLLNGTTAHTLVFASNDADAKLLAESQYGAGNVLGYTQVSD
jgi:hypothetical protein